MRTIRTKVYFFHELNKEGQSKALQNYFNINVDYNWWNSTYSDAEMIGLKITSFDLERNKHACGNFIISAYDTATKITENHGDMCETYSLAVGYLAGYDNINNEEETNQSIDELDEEFLKQILSAYADMLEKECEYLQSEEAIKSTFEANEYEFTSNGKMI